MVWLSIKFNLCLNDLLKPLAPQWVMLRFIQFLCSLAIIWLIRVAGRHAEDGKVCFSLPFVGFVGLHMAQPLMSSLSPHAWAASSPCSRQTRASCSTRRSRRAAWSTLQCQAGAEGQQSLFLYLRKETGIVRVSVLGFWWWHEEAIQDVWPSKCTVMHTSHLFSE